MYVVISGIFLSYNYEVNCILDYEFIIDLNVAHVCQQIIETVWKENREECGVLFEIISAAFLRRDKRD